MVKSNVLSWAVVITCNVHIWTYTAAQSLTLPAASRFSCELNALVSITEKPLHGYLKTRQCPVRCPREPKAREWWANWEGCALPHTRQPIAQVNQTDQLVQRKSGKALWKKRTHSRVLPKLRPGTQLCSQAPRGMYHFLHFFTRYSGM